MCRFPERGHEGRPKTNHSGRNCWLVSDHGEETTGGERLWKLDEIKKGSMNNNEPYDIQTKNKRNGLILQLRFFCLTKQGTSKGSLSCVLSSN